MLNISLMIGTCRAWAIAISILDLDLLPICFSDQWSQARKPKPKGRKPKVFTAVHTASSVTSPQNININNNNNKDKSP